MKSKAKFTSAQLEHIARITPCMLNNFLCERMLEDPRSPRIRRKRRFSLLQCAWANFAQRLIECGVPRTRRGVPYASEIVRNLFTRKKIRQYRREPHVMVAVGTGGFRGDFDVRVVLVADLNEEMFRRPGVTSIIPVGRELEEMVERADEILQ